MWHSIWVAVVCAQRYLLPRRLRPRRLRRGDRRDAPGHARQRKSPPHKQTPSQTLQTRRAHAVLCRASLQQREVTESCLRERCHAGPRQVHRLGRARPAAGRHPARPRQHHPVLRHQAGPAHRRQGAALTPPPPPAARRAKPHRRSTRVRHNLAWFSRLLLSVSLRGCAGRQEERLLRPHPGDGGPPRHHRRAGKCSPRRPHDISQPLDM